jgi:RNA methyltransferase, TrmH family
VTSAPVQFISSGGSALLKDLRRLSQDSGAYRKQGRVWLEGDHLCRAALDHGVLPRLVVFAGSLWREADPHWAGLECRKAVIEDALFASVSGLESPGRIAFVLDLPPVAEVQAQTASVVLDRVQDAGNVGAILRCAAAFGFHQVLAIKGTAALWSPKVLRAGMGSHFGLQLVEGLAPAALQALAIPLVTTSSHAGEWLHRLRLPWPCAWIFGNEGQGVAPELAAQARVTARIAQPGGEESLNVAAAAAICLHASAAAQAG